MYSPTARPASMPMIHTPTIIIILNNNNNMVRIFSHCMNPDVPSAVSQLPTD